MTYLPELGQMVFGAKYESISTPSHVTNGIQDIDGLLMQHLVGSKEVMTDLGTYHQDWGSTINSGWDWADYLPKDAPFSLHAYSWDEDDERPNFEHFASGFKAYWYKHSNRGETCNENMSLSSWRTIQRQIEDWILGRPRAQRVLITGSRDWASDLYEDKTNGKKTWKMLKENWIHQPSDDKSLMLDAFKSIRERANGAHIRVVHGGASGADSLAGGLAGLATNCTTEVHRALWNRTGDAYNRAAGFERNKRMVDAGADVCLAFFKKGSGNKGTKHCSDLARAAGIEVIEVWSA